MKPQLLAWPLAVLLTLPAQAQNLPQPARREPLRQESSSNEDELRNLIAGDRFPLALKLKDVDAGWRRMTISSQLEAAPGEAAPTAPSVPGEFSDKIITMFGGGADVYLTKGVTVKEGSDSFLVAYRVRLDRQVMHEFELSFPANAPRPTPESVGNFIKSFVQERPLDLSLVNLRMIGRVTDIRPFRFQDQMTQFSAFLKSEFAQANERVAASRNTQSLLYMRQLGFVLRQYLSDNDEVLPPMENAAVAKKALMPYAKNDAFFYYPHQPTQPYIPNPLLSRKKMAHLSQYESTLVTFYESGAAPDGTRAVLFLDGRTKRIKEAEWPQVKKASKIP